VRDLKRRRPEVVPTEEDNGTATVVMLTHEAREGAVREALQQIDALPHTLARTRLLRILG